MKQQWAPQELIDHWMLTDTEKALVNQYHTNPNRIASALLLKYFQREGKFPPRKQNIPRVIIEHIARQLHLETAVFDSYKWEKGTIDRHRSQLRKFLGFSMSTVADANAVLHWLETQGQLLDEHNFDRLKEIVYQRYKKLKMEPPQPKRIDRLVRSAVRSADERLYRTILAQLTPEAQEKLDALLSDNTQTGNISLLSNLKSEAGAATLENILTEIAKLERIRALSLHPDLFAGVSPKRLRWCKRRVAVEDLPEIRRHPPQVRYSLLAAFCIVRAEEITDTLIELLISGIHKMGSRAKHIVNKEVIRDIKRVQGKNRLLYEVAQAAIGKPEGTVKEVIYPVAPEQTLHDLVAEYKQGGLYEQRVQTIMRDSYSNHYQRMVPHILKALSFCPANEASKPIIEALALMRKYADKHAAFYPEDEYIPLEGVVRPGQLELVQQGQWINRINYELCGAANPA